MSVTDLTTTQTADLRFGRGDTPAFAITVTNLDTLDDWTIRAPIRRAAQLDPIDEWAVDVDGTTVRFSLTAEQTMRLPAVCLYSVEIELAPNSIRHPFGGRILLNDPDPCADGPTIAAPAMSAGGTGPPGPPGPPGPAGPQGPAGPAGAGSDPAVIDALDSRIDQLETRSLPMPPPVIQRFGPTDFSADPDTYTWHKPAHVPGCQPYTFVDVYLVGGGAGGGSGRRGAAGTLRTGGAGGASGGTLFRTIRFNVLYDTQVGVCVQRGGAGGAAVTADDTNGNSGGRPGAFDMDGNFDPTYDFTSFGRWACVRSGASPGGGGGSDYGAAEGGTAGFGGGDGASSTADGDVPAPPDVAGYSSPGGAGGGVNTSNYAGMGGEGGRSATTYLEPALTPEIEGANGTDGTSTVDDIPGLGGSGGCANPTGAGGRGGNGGRPGGGGGGGGASVNGYESGAGGGGGDGVCVVTVR